MSLSNKSLLDIKNLDIIYPIRKYHDITMRDTFVRVLKNPVEYFFSQREFVHIIDNISVQINRGEKVGLIGVNGSGKTSLCRHIAGMQGRQRNIKVNGKIRAILNTEMTFFPELSGRENARLLISFIYPHFNKKEKSEALREAIEYSELGELVDTPIMHFSKGMKVRLFLAIISYAPVDLLILDEVFDGADVFFNEKFSERIKKLMDSSGAVILVSHSFDQIRSVCDRVLVLNRGKIIFDGNVDKAIDVYQDVCRPK